MASPPQNHGFFNGFGRVLASRRVPPFCWRLRSTRNQYFLIPEHQKSIFSIPRASKINIFCPWSTKNQYFLSPWQSTKNQYLLSPEHHNSIFSLRIRLTNNQTPSAVAGTQLCCALDPPRQALCLRMAYRVPYPNKILILIPSLYSL